METFVPSSGSLSTTSPYTGDILDLEEEMEYVNREIHNGADAVIMQPLPGTKGEELLKKADKKVPIMFVEHGMSLTGSAAAIPVTKPDNYALGKALPPSDYMIRNGSVLHFTIPVPDILGHLR